MRRPQIVDKISCKQRINLLNAVLLIILIIIIGYFIRLYPGLNYSDIRGSWTVNIVYPIFYIIDLGHKLTLGAVETYTYSQGIYVELDDKTKSLVSAILVIMLGLTKAEYFIFQKYFLLLGLIVFPLCVTFLYSYYCKKAGRKYNNLDTILILLAAILANPLIISLTSYGEWANVHVPEWIFILISFYLSIKSKKSPIFVALFLLFTLSIVIHYRTVAMFYLAILVVMMIYNFFCIGIKGKENHIYSTRLPLTGIIIILFYYYYLSGSFLEMVIKMTVDAKILLGLEKYTLIEPYIIKSSMEIQILKAITLILSQLSLVYILFLFFRKSEIQANEDSIRMLQLWIVSLIPFSISIYAWGGLSNVLARMNVYGGIISLIAIALLFSSVKKSTVVHYIRLALIISSLLSISISIGLRSPPEDALSVTEYSAIEQLSINSKTNDTIFTDMRLATPFLLFNHMKVGGAITLAIEKDSKKSLQQLDSIYYGTNYSKAIQHIKLTETNPDYLFFSKRMAETNVGILGHSIRYKAAPLNFMDKYCKTPSINKLYDNGIVLIFVPNGTI